MPELPEILIIDDESDIGDILADFLEDDYSCSVFSDPLAAIEAIGNNQYALVITDLNMPTANGLQIIEAVKKSSHADTPVVVLTGNANDDPMVIEALKIGASGMMSKPFRSPDSIIESVKKFTS